MEMTINIPTGLGYKIKEQQIGPDLLTPKQPSQYNNNIQYYDAVINNREESLC